MTIDEALYQLVHCPTYGWSDEMKQALEMAIHALRTSRLAPEEFEDG